jgi:HK97 family phage major capsid protein
MALTLTESAKLSQNTLQRGVIEVMVRSSAILEILPFMEVVGNAYAYNQVSSLPTVAFRDINDGYSEASAGFTQVTESLKMLGGDVDVDKFLAQTRGNINDQRAIQTELKAKAIAEKYTSTFLCGDTTSDALSFNGMRKRLNGTSQTFAVADSTNGALTLDDLNKLVDKVPFGCDVLVMNRTTRRIILNLLQASTHYIETGKDAFGRPVEMYAGIPIRIVEDAMLPAVSSAHEIFAIKLGAMTDVCGIQNGGITVTDIGELETKPVYRTRIEWYCGACVFNPLSIASLTGIKK